MSSSSSSCHRRLTLGRFLNCHRRKVQQADGVMPPYTHVRYPNPGRGMCGGSFCIPSDKATTMRFFALYAEAVVDQGVQNLLEKKDRISPLNIDLDFRTKTVAASYGPGEGASPPPRLTEAGIREFLTSVMCSVDTWMDRESVRTWTDDMIFGGEDACDMAAGSTPPEEPYDPRVALVMRRGHTYDVRGITKDGLHVIFPELVLSSLAQHLVRGSTVLDLSAKKQAGDSVLGAYMKTMTTEPADVYDGACVEKAPWTMYGSDKVGKEGNPYEIVSVLRVGRRHGDYAVEELDIDEYVRGVTERLPRACRGMPPARRKVMAMALHLRMRCYGVPRAVARLRADFSEDRRLKTLVAEGLVPVPREQRFATTAVEFRDFGYASSLIRTCLSVDRASVYDEWLRIGWAACNISPPGNTALFDAWVEWSKRPPQYTAVAESSCEEKWRYFRRNVGYSSINTIEEAARSDDPEAFRRLQDEHLKERLVSALKTRDYEIAEIVTRYNNTGLRYKCTDQSSKKWCYYNPETGLWKTDKGHNPLALMLPRVIYPVMKRLVVEQHSAALIAANASGNENAVETANKERREKMRKLDPLMSNGKMVAVGNVVARILYDADFEDNLDQNLDLVSVGGGYVFDLTKGGIRRARPMDMLRKSTRQSFFPAHAALSDHSAAAAPPIADEEASSSEPREGEPDGESRGDAGDAPTEYHLEHPHVRMFIQFMSDIFPDDKTRHYVLKWLASHFSGVVKDELFHVLIGTGANGKSKLQSLMRLILGDYFGTLNITTFTGGRAAADGATAHYEYIRDKRSVWVQEPEDGERLNGGVLKECTGGDTMYSRALYEDAKEFKPQAKFALVCNHKPKLSAEDAALWRRIRCIRFKMIFKATPDPSNKLERQRDDELERKFPMMAPAGQWYLLTQYFPLYLREGILHDSQIPPEIYRETEQYRAANDEIEDFIQANMTYVGEDGMMAVGSPASNSDLVMEVTVATLCRRFTHFIENRRPRSSHLRVANNAERIKTLFAKRKRWKQPVDLDEGQLGWSQWVWKCNTATMMCGL